MSSGRGNLLLGEVEKASLRMKGGRVDRDATNGAPLDLRSRVREHLGQDLETIGRHYHFSLWIPLFSYLVFLIWINPFFEYVVGDDWIYARSSYDMLVHHVVKIHDPSVASLLWQAVWGYFFTLPFGFSFSALHLSTIVIFVIGVYFWYRTLRMFVTREVYVLAGTWMLIAIPPVPVLSISFNTDIHALAYLLIAIYFYLAYLKEYRWPHLAGGAVAASLGLLVRQTIILVPASVVATLVSIRHLKRVADSSDQAPWESSRSLEIQERTRNHKLVRLLFHALPFGVMAAYYGWIKWVHGTPFVWRYQYLEIFNFNRAVREIVADPIYTLHYSALFLLPVITTLLFSRDFYRKAAALLHRRVGKSVVGLAAVFVLGLTAYLAFYRNESMPYLQGDSYLLAEMVPLKWEWITGYTTVGAILVGLCLLPPVAKTLLRIQGRVLGSLVGRYLVKPIVRRTVEAALAVTALVAALGWFRPVMMAIGNSIVEYLYNTMGAIGGKHGYPLSFWTAQVADLYRQFRWVGSLILLALVPLVSFLAGNRKIEAGLTAASEVRLDVPQTVKVTPAATKPVMLTIGSARLKNIFLTLYMVLTVVFMILTGLRFDRYLLVFFPAVALLLLAQTTRIEISRGLLCGLLFGWMFFSALNAKAILAPQEASWNAFVDLQRQGVPVDKIDAGLYVTNWFAYKPEFYKRISLKERWWIDDAEYFITRHGIPGYHVVRSYPYHNPFLGTQYLYVLKRNAVSGGTTAKVE